MTWELAIALTALALSLWNLWRGEQANRQAALVLTYVDSAMVLENRGPASARDVKLVVKEGGHDQVNDDVPLLPNGYTHQTRYDRGLSQTPACSLSWSDGTWRRRTVNLSPSQERTRNAVEKPPLSDRQVKDLADGLAAGIARGFKDYMNDVARRGRR